MVGVPGRSTGCHNCRSRKIKCDGERPMCRNCAKSNRVCTGYQKKHAFILSKDMVDDKRGPSHDDTILPADGSDFTMVMVSRWRKEMTKSTRRSLTLPTASATKAEEMQFQSVQAVLARKSQLPNEIPLRNLVREGLFATSYYDPNKDGCSVSLAYGERNEWIMCVLSLPDLTPALEDILLAMSTAQLGQRTSRPDLLHESLRLYTKGLAQLSSNLRNLTRRNHDQSLAACMVSLLYEATASPAGTYDGYMAHYRGTLELLRLRGASSHKSGLAHSVFRIMRMHALFNSIVARKKIFLADPEWLDDPWLQPEQKPQLERLMDILVHLPELSAQRTFQESTQDPLELLAGALESIQTVQKLEVRLEKWFDDFKATVPGHLYYPELSKLDSPVDNPEMGKVFPVAFRFPAHIIGQNLVWYWVTQTALHAHLCTTYGSLTQLVGRLDGAGRDTYSCTCAGTNAPCLQHFSMGMLPPLGHRELWPRTTAYNVAQSIEYFMDDKQESIGPHGIVPAVLLIRGFWRYGPVDMSREIAWVDDRLQHVKAKVSGSARPVRTSIAKILDTITMIFCGRRVTSTDPTAQDDREPIFCKDSLQSMPRVVLPARREKKLPGDFSWQRNTPYELPAEKDIEPYDYLCDNGGCLTLQFRG